ncbi:SWIB/MDM2 domain-containing protein [Fimicolochytrium jonesii]|uniref:SWIB/MDM2 domain-containing protein n=1 Tax=Fimicolochytrium jonesii TaxID=1396493 RepID=UPI0022FE36CD|nr:SWIB/MDM2 domain-containing protein [Fimicolochytrium jonesii]KAI8816800.1 SWIB/MDM2 domain-containing protein [Fimicolochytrium jonesii]
MGSHFDVSQFDQRIRDILLVADLHSVSSKSVRLQLESDFGLSLGPWKRDLDDRIITILNSIQGETQEDHVKEETAANHHQQQSSSTRYPNHHQQPLPPSSSQALYPSIVASSEPSFQSTPTKRKAAPAGNKNKKIKSEDFVASSDDESAEFTGGDEELARRLQESENGRTRQTRSGGAPPRKGPARKKPASSSTEPKKATGINKPLVLSPALSEFLGGIELLARPEVVKRLWDYFKANDLQDPKDKRYIIVDESLQPIFGVNRKRVHMFTLNKLLTKHMIKPEDMAGGFGDVDELEEDENEDGTPVPRSSSSRSTPKKKEKRAPSTRTPSKNNPFNRPNALSPQLAAVLGGQTTLSRPQVVKQLWAYIKERGLQDPADGRMIICDQPLKDVFGVERVSGFKMNTYLSAHLTRLSDDDVSSQVTDEGVDEAIDDAEGGADDDEEEQPGDDEEYENPTPTPRPDINGHHPKQEEQAKDEYAEFHRLLGI